MCSSLSRIILLITYLTLLNSAWSANNSTVNVSATVIKVAQISNLTDVSFNAVNAGSIQTRSQSNCTFSNTTNGTYTVTASGSGTSNAFTLVSAPATVTIAYLVSWAGTSGASSGTPLTAGQASANVTSTATDTSCSSGLTSTLIISIVASELQKMTPLVNYTGTLTLLITPQ